MSVFRRLFQTVNKPVLRQSHFFLSFLQLPIYVPVAHDEYLYIFDVPYVHPFCLWMKSIKTHEQTAKLQAVQMVNDYLVGGFSKCTAMHSVQGQVCSGLDGTGHPSGKS